MAQDVCDDDPYEPFDEAELCIEDPAARKGDVGGANDDKSRRQICEEVIGRERNVRHAGGLTPFSGARQPSGPRHRPSNRKRGSATRLDLD
jgi:hypothetical protein